MILSISRRTDIPACYSRWFYRRLEEGMVCVPNPMNPRRIRRIAITPKGVDGMVFWTKNPIPMLDGLSRLQDYPFYFQFSLTPYDHKIETNLPNKEAVLLPAFQSLSNAIGRERVIWRYDPILLTDAFSLSDHIATFEAMAKRLSGYTETCVLSFVDLYRSTVTNTKGLGLHAPTEAEMHQIAAAFSRIAACHSIRLQSCCEAIDLSGYGISHGSCIDGALLQKIAGYPMTLKPDKNQRPGCGCVESVDIGMYHSCQNGCRYCYATHNPKAAAAAMARHNPASPLLIGELSIDAVITDVNPVSCREMQTRLF